MTDNKLGIVARQEISYDLFEGILVTALERGSAYWYSFVELEHTSNLDKDKYATDSGVIFLAKMVWYEHFNLRVMDKKDYDKFLGEVNLLSIKTAFETIRSQYPITYVKLTLEEYNEDDADVFFQIATFGKINFRRKNKKSEND
jgi:hypothetical protein